jgi:hypothetical protein
MWFPPGEVYEEEDTCMSCEEEDTCMWFQPGDVYVRMVCMNVCLCVCARARLSVLVHVCVCVSASPRFTRAICSCFQGCHRWEYMCVCVCVCVCVCARVRDTGQCLRRI